MIELILILWCVGLSAAGFYLYIQNGKRQREISENQKETYINNSKIRHLFAQWGENYEDS